jgi:hypothetical protein
MAEWNKLVMSGMTWLAASMPRRIQKVCDNEGDLLKDQMSKNDLVTISDKDISISSTFCYDFDSL